jgi:hypothetical protein
MDPIQIKYRVGHPLHFISTRPFALANTGVTIPKGTDVLFDGTKAEIEGAEYTVPQLRGAVKADWLRLAESYNPDMAVLPVSAGIQVRHPTQGGNPMDRQRMPTTVSEEERVVANTTSHAASTRSNNTGYIRGQTKVNATPRGVQAGQLVKTQRGMMEVESQDGIIVERAPLKTAAGDKAKFTRTSADMAGTVIADLGKVKIDPVAGVTRDELMERMSPEEAEEYLSEIEARKAAYVDEAPVGARPVSNGRQVVGRVNGSSTKEGHKEGMDFRTTVGGGVEIADPTGMGGKPEESEMESEGIKFKFVNGPKKDQQPSVHPRNEQARAEAPSGFDVRRKVAKALCPDFPEMYDFNQPARKKIARIMADFEDRPDVIRAIFAAETDDFKVMLVEAFPAVFDTAA